MIRLSTHSNTQYMTTVLIICQFPATTEHLDLVLSGFSLQEFGIHYLSASVNLRQFLLSDII